MAYADRNMSGSRIVALVIVALIHVALGYAFVTGLAYQYVKKVQENLQTFEVEEPPPPPEEEPPPPPPDQPVQPPPVVTPPPIVRTNTPPPVVIATVPTPPPVYAPPITAPPAPPAPPPAPPAPPRVAKALTPRGSPGSWVTNNDYPPAALRAGESGVTGFRLDVGPDGRVTNCSVTSSSGSSTLDDAACRLLMRRARFNPAEDASGAKIAAAYSSRFRWELPE
jgi:protein TonB